MFLIQSPHQITHDTKCAWGKINGLQQALISTVLSPNPAVTPIAIRALEQMNNLLQLNNLLQCALFLKAVSYLTGMNITLLSSVSLSTLSGAVIIGIVATIFIASVVIPTMQQQATKWIDSRIITNRPVQLKAGTNEHLKYITQSQLKALKETLTKYAPNWKQFIQSGEAHVVSNVLENPTYLYSDEQMAMLGQDFNTQYKAFVAAAQLACNKGSQLTDEDFQTEILDKITPLRQLIESKMEFWLFASDVQRLIDYKGQLFTYLRSQIGDDFPKEGKVTRTCIMGLIRRFHPDTGTEPNSQMQTLVQQAAVLFKTWKDLRLEEEGSTALTEGLWISNNSYEKLQESRALIEQALIQKGELKPRKGMTSPFPLFYTEADLYIATQALAKQ